MRSTRAALRLIRGAKKDYAMPGLVARLNEEDVKLSDTSTQDTPQAAPVIDHAELAKVAEDVKQQAAWRAFHERLAAVLNYVDLARRQGGHLFWTDAHAKEVVSMMEAGDRVLLGVDGKVPSGFGEPVAVRLDRQVEETIERLRGLPRAIGLKVPQSTRKVGGDEESSPRSSGAAEPAAGG